VTQVWLSGHIASTEPFVYYSTRGTGAPMGASLLFPDFFKKHPALHLINFTWSMEIGDIKWVAKDYDDAKRVLPDNHFVFLCNTEMESLLFARHGLPACVSSPAMFIDDALFHAEEPVARPRFDAIYLARLTKFKRHELAREIEKVALIYGPGWPAEPMLFDETRALLPGAYFANHDIAGGKYRQLSAAECVTLMHESSVGLALSAEEGVMRACLEYLLCGLPVVSTQSVGGRERYLLPPYGTIVPDDPAAVAAAVKAYVDRPMPRADIRAYMRSILAFERHCFLLALNAIVKDLFGMRDRFAAIPSSLNGATRFRSSDEILRELNTVFAGA
jgi:glycosyltransferase involved in cell wall biosynthesis